MSRYFDSTYAGVKVAWDKIYDYLYYYSSFKFVNEESSSDNIDDYIVDIDKTKYTNEKTNKRIYDSVGTRKAYEMFLSEPTHIIDNIMLGSAYNAASWYTLKDNNIKVIINMTKELSSYYENEHDLEYINYGLYDNNKDSMDKLDDIYQYIIKKQSELKNFDYTNDNDKWNGNILIHCYMGASRSASVVIYYLMIKKKYSFDEAIDYIKSKRPYINPTWRLTKDLANSTMKMKNKDDSNNNDNNNNILNTDLNNNLTNFNKIIDNNYDNDKQILYNNDDKTIINNYDFTE